ncbi:MAG: TauD/TfdA family dioxygenase [Actinobacteria bacterium]|nr:TauD/TfdA family dioxygenase [Actinomycetota bacterium]
MPGAVSTAGIAELELGDLSREQEEVRLGIERCGAVVVRGVPVADDALLVALTRALGEPSALGNGDGLIHDVRPKPPAEQRDLSSKTEAFPLHTDSTALVEPHAYVCLACVQSAAGAGGESLLAQVDVIRAALAEREGPGCLDSLEEPVFPFPLNDPRHGQGFRTAPILMPTTRGHTIRYRGDALAIGRRAYPEALSEPHRRALSALEAVLADGDLHASYSLEPGDVLFVDNRRALHGRTAIAPGAQRHLRRLKIFASAAFR